MVWGSSSEPFFWLEASGKGSGRGVGLSVGRGVGLCVGRGVGLAVGCGVGRSVGLCVGRGVGLAVGRGVGLAVGRGVGLCVGRGVGLGVGRGVGRRSALGCRWLGRGRPAELHSQAWKGCEHWSWTAPWYRAFGRAFEGSELLAGAGVVDGGGGGLGGGDGRGGGEGGAGCENKMLPRFGARGSVGSGVGAGVDERFEGTTREGAASGKKPWLR